MWIKYPETETPIRAVNLAGNRAAEGLFVHNATTGAIGGSIMGSLHDLDIAIEMREIN